MGERFYEVRSGIARVLFCTHHGKMVLLHGFVKKSRRNAGWRAAEAVGKRVNITFEDLVTA